MDNLAQLKVLAGVKKHTFTEDEGSNISLTGVEKRELEKKHNIQPGTPEWFQLWFSRPYLTGEKPL